MSSRAKLKCLRVSSVLIFLALLFVLAPASRSFNLTKFCEERCFKGRGGRVCSCYPDYFTGIWLAVDGAVAKRDFVSKSRDQNERLEGPAANGPNSHHAFRQRHDGDGNMELDASDDSSLLVGGFVDDDGRQRSTAVQKLASLLKDAIDERLVDNMPPGKSSPWQNDVPYEEDGAMY